MKHTDPRAASSTRCYSDDFGELHFAGDCNGPVIHRTPKELGLMRVIADGPQMTPVREVLPDWTKPRAGTIRARRLKRDRLATNL